MLRVFVCLFVFSILSIAVRFGDCENTTPDTECQDINITPGSDKTRLSNFEKLLNGLKSPFDALGNIIGKRKNETQSYGSVLDKFSDYVHAIYPGTLWCGDGDIARGKDKLGLFKRTDACCREHDKCKNSVLTGKTKVNLNNNGIFTRSACTCDTKFYKCLKNANSPIAYKIGKMYFNILGPQCFRCVCPTGDCDLEDDTECKDYCMKYEWVNNSKY